MFGDPVKNEEGKTALSDILEFNPRKSELSASDDLEVSFVPITNVGEDGEFDCSIIKRYSEVKSGFTYFKEDDILFAKITPCMENGKGAIAKGLRNKIGFGSTEFHVLRPNENIRSEFIFSLLAQNSVRTFAEVNMTGSAGQKRVPTEFLKKIKIDLPHITSKTSSLPLPKIYNIKSSR